MAFSVQSDRIDELARRRAQRDALMQAELQASQGIVAGLGVANKAQQDQTQALRLVEADKRAEKAQESTLRMQDANTANMQADNARADADSLRLRETADLAAKRAALSDADKQRGAALASALGGMSSTDVAALAVDDAKVVDLSRRTTATLDEVRAAARARVRAEAEAAAAAASQADKDAADIELKKAQTTKALRPPVVDPNKAADAELNRTLKKAQIVALGGKLDDINNPFSVDEKTSGKLKDERIAIMKQQAAANGIRALIAKYPKLASYTGPINGRVELLKSALGLSDQEAATVASSLLRAFTAYKVAATGASAGVQEMADIMRTLPNATDPVSAMLGKLDADDLMATTALSRIDAQLGGRDIRATAEHPDPQAAALSTEEIKKRLGEVP